jgi:hypothetical protein
MAKTDKPNILVIWGDDIGITNLSCYSSGLMGYQTPNIDRVANEGIRFTDAYGEQSCTAGRSSFITGQSVYRTGLSKVGVPASPIARHGLTAVILPGAESQHHPERVRYRSRGHIRGRDVPVSPARSPPSGVTVDERADAVDGARRRRTVRSPPRGDDRAGRHLGVAGSADPSEEGTQGWRHGGLHIGLLVSALDCRHPGSRPRRSFCI